MASKLQLARAGSESLKIISKFFCSFCGEKLGEKKKWWFRLNKRFLFPFYFPPPRRFDGTGLLPWQRGGEERKFGTGCS